MERLVVIHIEDVTKYFGSFAGVNDISLDVFSGEIFGFLGPNGAGKTTTIRMLLDLLRPTAGQIYLFGKQIKGHSEEIRKKCGYLPGSFSAYGNLTGLEFLRFCAALRGIGGNPGAELAERFELSGQSLERKIKYLSHGTAQKLGIVQAFFHRPELLILDEPTIGLDPLMQEEFYRLLEERRREGATTFLSTHNLGEVERVCHRMAIIRNGRIETKDTIENLRKILRKKIILTLSHPVGELKLAEAELVKHEGLTYEFLLGRNIGKTLQELSALPVADLTIPEPGLEEIFINFYKEKDEDHD
ncbi:MAG: ABC transporter ATP-binding protein [Bacteroidales bacterium]|nr:ABC transporter ATP-binding protein [Bacteroidales bacterium]